MRFNGGLPSATASFALVFAVVKRRIEGVEVPRVEIVLRDAERFAEALEVDHFTLAQEFDRFAYIRVIDEAQNIVVGRPGLLLCCNHIRTTFD